MTNKFIPKVNYHIFTITLQFLNPQKIVILKQTFRYNLFLSAEIIIFVTYRSNERE